MSNPRYYQVNAIQKVNEAPSNSWSILAMPTGTGKTFVACDIIKGEHAVGRSVCFVVDRLVLLDQASKELHENQVFHDVIQGKKKHLGFKVGNARVAVASSQTLEKALDLIEEFDTIIIDECHSIRQKFLDAIPLDKKVVGLTATPINRTLIKYYEKKLINVITTNKAIEEKYLVPIEPHVGTRREGMSQIDMTGKRKVAGEYTDKDVADSARQITGNIVEEYLKKTSQLELMGAKTLVFAATVKHGEELLEEFNVAGCNFGHVSYLSGKNKSEKEIERFHKGELRGLISCEKLGKGFNDPEVQIMVCARTYASSVQAWFQMLGRGLRACEHLDKKSVHLFDHSGNYERFFPAMEGFYEYGMEELEDSPFKACKKCGKIYPVENIEDEFTCMACRPKRPKKGRQEAEPVEVFVEAGELKSFEQPNDYMVWKQICAIGKNLLSYGKYKGESIRIKKWAYVQYKQELGRRPPPSWYFLPHKGPIDQELLARVKGRYDDFVKGKSINEGANTVPSNDAPPLTDEDAPPLDDAEDKEQFAQLVKSEIWRKSGTKQGTMDFLL